MILDFYFSFVVYTDDDSPEGNDINIQLSDTYANGRNLCHEFP